MQKGRVLISLILAVIVVALLLAVSFTDKNAKGGYEVASEIDGKQWYAQTIVNSYDNEPDWRPGDALNTSTQPEIAGTSGIIVDLNSGKVLFEKKSTEKRKVASLTKIMTAVVALEHKKIDEKIYVTEEAANIGENEMGIDAGEVYTLEELLYGLVLPSGNDAAFAIAQGVGGNIGTFVDWMNIKANEIGLKDTHFVDPSGLDDPPYSTAVDLVKLTRYALKSPEFRKIVGTLEIELVGDEHKYIYMYNQTNLLATYPGVKGVKTGYTEEAGLTLVTYAQNNGIELVGVVLGSGDRKGDMILMLDHGFGTMGVKIEHNLL